MIKRPIALVLGAGASKPYGFPTARELLREIRRSLRKELTFRQRLTGADYSESDVKELMDALAGSPVGSVDEFLEIPAHKNLVGVGKAAIAAWLLPHETPLHLLPDEQEDDDWYEYLFRRIKEGARTLDEFLQNGISFVTFNYDRSLEQFLLQALRSTYRATGQQVWEAMKRGRLKIVHVYGSFGALPDLGGDLPYGTEPTLSGILLRKAAESIHIAGEPGAQDGINAAQGVLMPCERICFLGFGYRRANVERLELKATLRKDATIFGSVYELLRGEIGDTRQQFVRENHRLLTADTDRDARATLRDLPVLSEYDLKDVGYLGNS